MSSTSCGRPRRTAAVTRTPVSRWAVGRTRRPLRGGPPPVGRGTVREPDQVIGLSCSFLSVRANYFVSLSNFFAEARGHLSAGQHAGQSGPRHQRGQYCDPSGPSGPSGPSVLCCPGRRAGRPRGRGRGPGCPSPAPAAAAAHSGPARATDQAIVAAARHADRAVVVFDPIAGHWHFPRIRDHLHPTAAGHRWIAGRLAAGLRPPDRGLKSGHRLNAPARGVLV